MNLINNDKILVAALTLFFFIISFIGWLMYGGVILIISLAIVVGLLITMQIESYRRTQRKLKQLQEEQQRQEEQTQKIRKQIDMVLNTIVDNWEDISCLETKDDVVPKSFKDLLKDTLKEVKEIRPPPQHNPFQTKR